MGADKCPDAPSLPWRAGSTAVMGITGLLCRGFLFGASRTEVHGLDGFLKLLDARQDVQGRQRGLITVSNHTSVMDDPIIWGVLPVGYMFNPDNLRWGLGSYDICFKNNGHSLISTFFSLGQVLPTHRTAHSRHGGLFQPTMTQAIRLLSRGPFPQPTNPTPAGTTTAVASPPPTSPPSYSDSEAAFPREDPFSEPHLTYTTNTLDTFPAPAAYASRRHAWLHIFPEGKVHQKPDKTMRYFKWGVSRLILEAEPAPELVPVWIEGLDGVLHEARSWPRWWPRWGYRVGVWFGESVDTGVGEWGELRGRWRRLVEREEGRGRWRGDRDVGVLSEELKYGNEAVELRMECAMRVREEVLKVRRRRGLPDEDPKVGRWETWREEGSKKEGRMEDGSWVRDT